LISFIYAMCISAYHTSSYFQRTDHPCVLEIWPHESDTFPPFLRHISYSQNHQNHLDTDVWKYRSHLLKTASCWTTSHRMIPDINWPPLMWKAGIKWNFKNFKYRHQNIKEFWKKKKKMSGSGHLGSCWIKHNLQKITIWLMRLKTVWLCLCGETVKTEQSFCLPGIREMRLVTAGFRLCLT
jgi:hypothetical protein